MREIWRDDSEKYSGDRKASGRSSFVDMVGVIRTNYLAITQSAYYPGRSSLLCKQLMLTIVFDAVSIDINSKD